MKNPWMSMWLSAANKAAGAARGFGTAELHRQQKALAKEGSWVTNIQEAGDLEASEQSPFLIPDCAPSCACRFNREMLAPPPESAGGALGSSMIVRSAGLSRREGVEAPRGRHHRRRCGGRGGASGLPLVPYLDTLRWLFIAIALSGIAVAIYARLDDWKKRGQGDDRCNVERDAQEFAPMIADIVAAGHRSLRAIDELNARGKLAGRGGRWQVSTA